MPNYTKLSGAWYKYYASLIVFLLGINLVACGQKAVKVEQFAEKLKQSDSPQLIDVRTPEEYNAGHIPGATLINFNSPEFYTQALKLDKQQPVFVYCLAGGRSREAAEFLHKNNFKEVYDLKGGFNAWKTEKMPITNPGTTTNNTTESPENKVWTHAEVMTLVGKHEKVLLDFYATWCGPCRIMEPEIKKVHSEGKITVIKVNLDNNSELAHHYHITEIPVLLCFKNGKQVMRLEGIQKAKEIYAAF